MTILGVELKLLNILLSIGQLHKSNLTFTIVYSRISSCHITEMHKQQKMRQYVIFQSLYLSVFVSFLQGDPFFFLSPIVLSSLVSLTDRLGITKSKSIWAFIKFGRLPSKDI